MERKDITSGDEYGYREVPRRVDEPLQHVRVIEQVRSKWKVEWINPHAGLRDYAKSSQLLTAWRDREAFSDEERSWTTLAQVCDMEWPGHEHPLTEAVGTVLSSTGEAVWIDNRGALSGPGDALNRICERASFQLELKAPAFVDRRGDAHHPFASGVELAQAFAISEPETVLLQVETTDQEYSNKARELGNSYLVPLVLRWRAGWALCRQWAGFDRALAVRDTEIVRLKRIIRECELQLRRDGQNDLAAQLRRRLEP